MADLEDRGVSPKAGGASPPSSKDGGVGVHGGGGASPNGRGASPQKSAAEQLAELRRSGASPRAQAGRSLAARGPLASPAAHAASPPTAATRRVTPPRQTPLTRVPPASLVSPEAVRVDEDEGRQSGGGHKRPLQSSLAEFVLGMRQTL